MWEFTGSFGCGCLIHWNDPRPSGRRARCTGRFCSRWIGCQTPSVLFLQPRTSSVRSPGAENAAQEQVGGGKAALAGRQQSSGVASSSLLHHKQLSSARRCCWQTFFWLLYAAEAPVTHQSADASPPLCSPRLSSGRRPRPEACLHICPGPGRILPRDPSPR